MGTAILSILSAILILFLLLTANFLIEMGAVLWIMILISAAIVEIDEWFDKRYNINKYNNKGDNNNGKQ